MSTQNLKIKFELFFLLLGKSTSSHEFGPNLNEFVRRFDTATTNGQGPSWLKNLYFAYLLVLRAITKMEIYWIGYHFYTGNSKDDAIIYDKVIQIVRAAK
jgi:ERO1-like protein beta